MYVMGTMAAPPTPVIRPSDSQRGQNVGEVLQLPSQPPYGNGNQTTRPSPSSPSVSQSSRSLAESQPSTSSRAKIARSLVKSDSTVRRSSRPRTQPTRLPTSAVLRQKTFRLPLPSDIDPDYSITVTLKNKDIGINLACEGLMTDGPLNRYIARSFEQAPYTMAHYFLDGTIATQRAYFAYERPPPKPALTPLMALADFTRGHLLTLLAQLQYKHWQEIAKEDRFDLQYIVDRSKAPIAGVMVHASNIYIVAIRRRGSLKEGFCYVPELETMHMRMRLMSRLGQFYAALDRHSPLWPAEARAYARSAAADECSMNQALEWAPVMVGVLPTPRPHVQASAGLPQPQQTPRSMGAATPAPSVGSQARKALIGLVVPVPLPHDVDTTFRIPVTVAGKPGLRLASCAGATKQVPNEAISARVDGAADCIDPLVRIPGKKFIVHRAFFPSQRGTEAYVASKLPDEAGFTVAHLLTLIVRKQYDGWMKSFGRMRSPAKAEDVVGWGTAVPPDTEVHYEDLYVVAVRRSNGADGRIRWFPQLEVRFEDAV
ncbi:hypothetical protein C8Q77DRAFT_1072720 [Trametes polyzona]|nr:hypothetical protein C8Q77DRAFT_1072720 [Trametes polyzona]